MGHEGRENTLVFIDLAFGRGDVLALSSYEVREDRAGKRINLDWPKRILGDPRTTHAFSVAACGKAAREFLGPAKEHRRTPLSPLPSRYLRPSGPMDKSCRRVVRSIARDVEFQSEGIARLKRGLNGRKIAAISNNDKKRRDISRNREKTRARGVRATLSKNTEETRFSRVSIDATTVSAAHSHLTLGAKCAVRIYGPFDFGWEL